jgi:RimJ/RimL family protein N-acetyltransferase
MRPFALTDAQDVQRLAAERSIADTTLNIPHPYEVGVAEAWIATHEPKYEAGELVNFAITLRAEKRLIGAIGLKLERAFDKAELGYWIGVPFWSRGYCTEATRAVIDHGFAALELNRIYAHHLARNPASGRVMQKAGMAYEGVARQDTKKWGKHEDLVLYGIVREAWSGARRGDDPL